MFKGRVAPFLIEANRVQDIDTPIDWELAEIKYKYIYERVLFRVDSAQHIGTGHLYRCLNLANELSFEGFEVCFAVGDFGKQFYEVLELTNFRVHYIEKNLLKVNPLDHKKWLGSSNEIELKQLSRIVEDIGNVDYLVIDHYSISEFVEYGITNKVGKIVVIDDLLDRNHFADFIVTPVETSKTPTCNKKFHL